MYILLRFLYLYLPSLWSYEELFSLSFFLTLPAFLPSQVKHSVSLEFSNIDSYLFQPLWYRSADADAVDHFPPARLVWCLEEMDSMTARCLGHVTGKQAEIITPFKLHCRCKVFSVKMHCEVGNKLLATSVLHHLFKGHCSKSHIVWWTCK